MSAATTPVRSARRIFGRGLLVFFLFIAASAAFGKDAKIYTVPIRVHLITGAEFRADGTNVDLWLTPDEFTKEVLPEMNRIWQPAGVQWRIASLAVEAAVKSSSATKALAGIEQQSKDTAAMWALLPQPDRNPKGAIDLYLLPSIGSANGVARPADRIAAVGIWRKPGKRPYHRAPVVLTDPPYVSVAKTCAHELGHNLGLKHPDPGLKDRLMIAGPGLLLTAEEIATARDVAAGLSD